MRTMVATAAFAAAFSSLLGEPVDLSKDAAAFGMSCAAADNAPALNRALDWCRANGATRLTVAPGTYRFTSDTPIRMEGLKDFTFDGGGAKFVFYRTRGESFCVTGCVRTVIRNLSVDWDWAVDPLGSLVKVVEADRTHLDLEFVDYRRFPRRDVRIAYLSAWDAAARAVGVPGLSRLGRGIDMSWVGPRKDARKEWLSDNVLRIHKGAADLPVGSVWRAQHYYYDLNCFRLVSNDALTVEGVDVLSCPGFAFLIDGKQRDTLFRRVTIRPPADDPKRVISCTADHVHVARSNGNLRLEGCDFALGADDCLNVHDVTAWAPEVRGEKTLEVRNGAGAFDVGDEVAIRNADYSPSAEGVFKVVSKRPVEGNPRGAVVAFDRPVPPKAHKYGFVLFNRSYCSDGVVLKDCTFGGNRARGVIIQCNDVLIENCRFWHTESEALKVTTGWTEDLWCEGVGVTNCVVRNCTFDSCQAGADGPNRDKVIFLSTYLRQPSYARGWESSDYPVFDRIRFEDNAFVGCGKYPERDSSWGSVTFAARAAEPVDVFIGTAGLGHVSPAACAPFGAVQAGPDTSASPEKYVGDWPHTSGYQHGDGWLWRFSQTRLSGTGCPSGGDFGLLPFAGAEPRAAQMIKSTERARPGFYAVDLADGISCAVAAAPHGAVYRFAYPKGASARLLVDTDWTIARRGADDGKLWGVFATHVKASEIRALSPTRLVARRKVRAWVDYEIFCALDFSRPVVSRDGGTCAFGALPDDVLEVRLALSATSAEAAAANLDAELAGQSLEAVAARTASAWDAYLSRVRLAPGTDPAVRASFRAALYRTAIQPNDIGDVGRTDYSTFSLWDTFRAAHPLYTLLAPERVDGFVRSLLKVYERNGYLPIWGLRGTDTHCMIGHHAVPVIVDAYLKGFRGFDADLAWRAVLDSLTREHTAVNDATWGLLKEDWPLLDRYGYLPYDALTGGSRGHKVVGESVSRLFEGAYDDACAARFAAALGKAGDAAFFARRAGLWRNALDPETKFARGRNAAGGWREPFDPKACGHCWFQPNDFTEGNAMQYTWHVMQDPDGLVAALGGRDAALAKLKELFSGASVAYGENGVSDVTGLIGQYAHGNEPSHHIIYFFTLLGRPDLAAAYVKKVFDTQYRPTPDGLCGNDDCGQMSAWYVFSALGFYPFDPCGGDYVVGAPQVPGAELDLPGGKTLKIVTEGFSPGGAVAEVVLNGKALPDFRLRHADLVRGGTLVFRMKRTEDAASFARAEPVWAVGRADEKNVFLGFRGDFTAKAGEPTTLRIAASSLYRVFLNGAFVGYGPARGPNGFYRVDAWELPCRDGRNALAVEVLNYNVRNYYVHRDSGFLRAEVFSGGRSVLATGAPDGFSARVLPKVQRCSRFSFQRGFAEAYALAPDFADWRTNGAPGAAVATARAEARPLLPRLAPLPRLDCRPLAFVGETDATYDAARTVPPQRHVTWGGWDAVRDAFPTEELAVDVHDVIARVDVARTRPASGGVALVGDGKGALVDGGLNDTGFLGLTVDCRRPGRLIVTFDEVLTDGKVNPLRLGADFGFVYDLKEPGVYRLENFEPNTFRYAHLFMKDGLAAVSAPYVRSYKNAEAYKARFRSSDPALDALFDAARETFAQNAVDVFTDCPSRERAGWLCDSFFIARVSRLLTGSLSLEDLFLDNYARAASFDVADGMLPMCYPGDHANGTYIPNWAMWLVLELDEYARRGGDARMIASFRPRLEKLLAALWRYRNADGLLERLPSWVFVEWSQANKWVQDVSYPSNMLWAETLDALDRLYGRPDLAAEAARVRETVRRQSWDGRWFRDHAVRQADGSLAVVPGDISETCQYYALFFKVATPETHPELWRTLVEAFGPSRLDADKKPTAYPQVAPSNAFIGNYLRLECLSRAGLSERVLAECRGYFAAMAAQTGTLWEFDKSTHSCCHGFASHVAVLLVRDVLGVKKIDPVARTVAFDPPARSPLVFCEVALPTTDGGSLEVGWRRRDDGTVERTVRLPKGWRLASESVSQGKE